MNREVLLKIGEFVYDLPTLRALRCVCKAAKNACEILKPLKQYQFAYLYIEYNGYNYWTIRELKKEEEHPTPQVHELSDSIQVPSCLFTEPTGFVMRRIDLLSFPQPSNIINICR